MGELRVVAPLSSGDVDTLLAVQTFAQDTWSAQKAAPGDGLPARFATMQALQKQPGVEGVTLSSETGSIGILFTSGARGELGLEPRFRLPDATPALAGASTAAVPAGASTAVARADDVATSTSSAAACPIASRCRPTA